VRQVEAGATCEQSLYHASRPALRAAVSCRRDSRAPVSGAALPVQIGVTCHDDRTAVSSGGLVDLPRPPISRLIMQSRDRPASYRARLSTTVGRDAPVRRAISAFGVPSAASNTIRARCASPARIELDRTIPSSANDHPHQDQRCSNRHDFIVSHQPP
jgi:hypothetical protein